MSQNKSIQNLSLLKKLYTQQRFRILKYALIVVCISIGTALFPHNVGAYIPRTRYILSRAAKTHGKSIYKIEQELQFKSETENSLVKETWIVVDGDRARLQASGQKNSLDRWSLEILYKDNKRYVAEAQGLKSYPLSRDYFEPFFIARSGQDLTHLLLRAEILTQTLLSQKQKTVSGVDHGVEPYARLARDQGSVVYAIGAPTPAQAQFSKPTLWVEQDSFNIKRIRSKTQSEIKAEDYREYEDEFFWPTHRTIQWNNHIVTIKTLSVKALKNASVENLLSTQSLESKLNKTPPDPLVQEFYSRFR